MKLRPIKKAYRAKRVRGIKPKPKGKVLRKASRVRKRSSLELLVYSWLDRADIKYKKEKGIGRCHVDVFIEPNIILEAQGCHWHRCPRCYQANTLEDREKRLKDAKRFAYFRSRGYIVLEVWECDATSKVTSEVTRKKLIKKIRRLVREYTKGDE